MAGLTLDSLFDATNQDKLAMAYLEQSGLSKYKKGKITAKRFANQVAGVFAALPDESGKSVYAGDAIGNAATVSRDKYMEVIKGAKMMQGGVTSLSGTNTYSSSMVDQSRKEFAKEIAQAVTPVVVPIPMGGGGGGGGRDASGPNLPFPVLQSVDNSILAMEYKLKRLSWGGKV